MGRGRSINVEQKSEINQKQCEQDEDVNPGRKYERSDELHADEREYDAFDGVPDFPPPFVHGRFLPFPSITSF
jgi:hypothetical protein